MAGNWAKSFNHNLAMALFREHPGCDQGCQFAF